MSRKQKRFPVPGGNAFDPLERMLRKLGFITGRITAIRTNGRTSLVHLTLQDKEFLQNKSLLIEPQQITEAWNLFQAHNLCRKTVIDFLKTSEIRYGKVCFLIESSKVKRTECYETFLTEEENR